VEYGISSQFFHNFQRGYQPMKLSLRALSLVSCVAVLAAAAGTASAGTINGTVYYGLNGPSGSNPQGQGYAINGVSLATLSNAISTTASGGALNSTFTATSVNFTTGPGQGPSTFLNFLNPVANGVVFTGGTSPVGQSSTGNLIVLTGTVFLASGATYDLFHDDGINLYIAPLGTSTFTTLDSTDVESEQGQTTAGTSANVDGQDFTWSGASGYYDFDLIYVSNYENPSTLIAGSNLNSTLGATPEPSSFILLGSGLLAAAGMMRRRMAV
jgi:PEP-CTERM motif